MKPYLHALSSVRKYGGKAEDYLPIHNLMDSSKAAIADNRHRALTHNSWFIGTILEKIFGVVITNSDGKPISVRDIGEDHVLEDYGKKYIPTAQDFLQEMEYKSWMQNGDGFPPSFTKMAKQGKRVRSVLMDFTKGKNHDENRAIPEGKESGCRGEEDSGSCGQGNVAGND